MVCTTFGLCSPYGIKSTTTDDKLKSSTTPKLQKNLSFTLQYNNHVNRIKMWAHNKTVEMNAAGEAAEFIKIFKRILRFVCDHCKAEVETVTNNNISSGFMQGRFHVISSLKNIHRITVTEMVVDWMHHDMTT